MSVRDNIRVAFWFQHVVSREECVVHPSGVVDKVINAPCDEVVPERPARVADPSTMVIFGATGEAASR